MTESEIIEGCKRSERKAQEQLYRMHYRKMFGLCRGYAKDEDDAKDILQEGFVKVFRNINNFIEGGSLECWIRRIVVNTAIDKYRQSASIFRLSQEYYNDQQPAIDNSILERIDSDELLAFVRDLPEGTRLVFNLYAVEGYKHREIAEILDITEGTSKSQLHEAKKMLQKKIEKVYGKSFRYYVRRVLQMV